MSGANSQWLSRSMKGAMAGLLILGLSACAESLDTRVTRFQSQLPAPQGQTFAVVADDPSLAGGIEFGQYAKLVAGELTKKGYTESVNPDAANLIVRFSYGVDKGRVHVRSTGMRDPFWGPWYGPGFRRGGFYGGGWGGGFYGRGMGGWGYGWYDPWFDQGVESYTVYTSGISVKIDDKTANKRVFEGKAEAASSSNKLTWLVPNLVEAFFTGFPGNSGETLRITVAPEKTTVKGPAR
jgi:hypothetical protein